MTSIKILRMACVLLASMAVFNCSDSGGGKQEQDDIGKTNDGHDVRTFQEGVLDDILTRIDTTAITDTSFSGTLIFKNMNPDDIPNVGDIISSAQTKIAKYGFLYKVLGVSTKNGITEVVVRQASLEEAIKNVDFKGEVEFDFDEDGNTLEVRQKIYPIDSKPIALPILLVKEGIELKYGNVKGSIDVEAKTTAKFVLDIKIEDWKLKSLKMVLGQYNELSIEGKVEGKMEGSKVYPIGREIHLPTAAFFVGGVFLVFDNSLQMNLKIAGDAQMGMRVKYAFNDNHDAGFKYENEHIQLIAECNHMKPSFDYEQYNAGNIRIGIVPGFTSKLFGLPGLSLNAGPALELSVKNANPIGVFVYDKGFSEVENGVKLSLGTDMDMWFSLKAFRRNLFEYNVGEKFIEHAVLYKTSFLPKFATPKVSETGTGSINVESTIERNILNYPVGEFGFCIEKSAGECKNGGGNRKTISTTVAFYVEKRPFNLSFNGLEEGTTYRIMPYFDTGLGGTYYDKATVYPQSSSSSSNPSSSSNKSPSSSSASAPCGGTGLDGVWTAGDVDVTISGSTGVLSAYYEDDGFKVGDQVYKGLTSTGNLTWSGLEHIWEESMNGTKKWYWGDIRLTMSADGQRLTLFHLYPGISGETATFTRKCNN